MSNIDQIPTLPIWQTFPQCADTDAFAEQYADAYPSARSCRTLPSFQHWQCPSGIANAVSRTFIFPILCRMGYISLPSVLTASRPRDAGPLRAIGQLSIPGCQQLLGKD
jgi:hypothetical protein